MKVSKKNLVIGIYSHAELYPPTINAIHQLAPLFDKIVLIQRANLENNWPYPSNVIVLSQGKLMSARQQEALPLYKKVQLFAEFTIALLYNIKKYFPKCVLLYDPLALYLFDRIRPLVSKKIIVWYHNHDVADLNLVRKYSVSWFAFRAEKRIFKYLSIFTLPSLDRLVNFPMTSSSAKHFVIKNYPRCSFYSNFYNRKALDKVVKLVFQGHVSDNHGLEQIINLLSQKVKGYSLQLVIKGPCLPQYRLTLEQIANNLNVANQVEFFGVTSYAEVPKVASTCHIGIGIHAKDDIMNVTLGTASNKLYEYAALGLPILYYDKEYFTRYLSKYQWAIATLLDEASLLASIEKIINDYDELSLAAHSDFLQSLNFEIEFRPVTEYFQQKITAI